MRRVFSVKKLEESMKKEGCSKEEIKRNIVLWAYECDGKEIFIGELGDRYIGRMFGLLSHKDWEEDVE